MGERLLGVALSSGPCDWGRMLGEGRGERRPVLEWGRECEPSEPRPGDCWGGSGICGTSEGGMGRRGDGGQSDDHVGRIEAVKEPEKDTGVVGRLIFIGEEV